MNEQMEKYVAPVRELNKLAIANVEKLVEMQLQRLQENAKIGVDQMKSAAEISDVEAFKEYMTGCTELARKLSEQAVEDVRTVFEMGNAYSTEAQRIFKDSIGSN